MRRGLVCRIPSALHVTAVSFIAPSGGVSSRDQSQRFESCTGAGTEPCSLMPHFRTFPEPDGRHLTARRLECHFGLSPLGGSRWAAIVSAVDVADLPSLWVRVHRADSCTGRARLGAECSSNETEFQSRPWDHLSVSFGGRILIISLISEATIGVPETREVLPRRALRADPSVLIGASHCSVGPSQNEN
ncbi:hypothetical protein SKAU_G00384010 [Synaphobranchus kaupii]|uniref:Uncharacterized protein n=1 Tax=Synaphobranchus kaupii TaxID=118154 RepID=A0A9Q1EEF3_SYNKA|nr:hypothetical protein SKAU_G00384010 [Synaphobranchus kaupii]